MNQPRTVWVVTAVAVVLLLARAWPHAATVVDDAWISARYARNLGIGHGLVYNVGEAPVEGYTNLGFVVLLAAAWRVGLDMHNAMVGLGLWFAALGLVAATGLTRALIGRSSVWAAVPALWLAADPHYAVVATNGIESSMFVCGVLAACWAGTAVGERWRWLGGLWVGSVIAVRPEGIAVALAVVVWDLWQHPIPWRAPRRWWFVVGFVLWAAPVWIGRRLYFGAWVPNTFSAKAHKDLVDQVSFNFDYLNPDGEFWIGVAVLFVGAMVAGRRSWLHLYVGGIAAGLAVVAFSVDMWMPGGRLLLPSVALTCCLTAAAFAKVPERHQRLAGGVAALLAIPLLVGKVPTHVFRYDENHTALPGNGAERAAYHLSMYARPGATLAIRDAGVFAYHVGPAVTVIEIHPRSLTRPHPGGRPFDVDDVPPNPDFFVATVSRESHTESIYSGDRDLARAFTVPYTHLGRAYQHYHRYYDVYARSDLDVPPLPDAAVVPHPELKPFAAP